MPLWQKNSLYAVLLISTVAGGYSALPYVQQHYHCALLENVLLSPGEKQVRQLLIDRPKMAVYLGLNGEEKKLTSQDAIWQWAAKAYDAHVIGELIVWDNHDLLAKPSNYLAENSTPWHGHPGAIRIRDAILKADGTKEETSFEKFWNACFFELINIKNADKSLVIYKQGLEGKLNRAQFVRAYQMAEYQSLVKLKQVYQEVWKPWAESHHVSSDLDLWEQNLPSSYEKWMSERYSDGVTYTYFEDYYDKNVAPNVKNKKN